jgi:hypothetical protein
VIATGQSGSAAQLRHYHNSIHPLAGGIDGFVMHGAGRTVRTDLRTPVFKLMAETDVIRLQGGLRQPDSDYLRTWEVAGSSHLDVDVIERHDRLRDRDRPELTQPPRAQPCATLSPSRVPALLVQEVVYDWMKQWVEGPAKPPRAPPIDLVSVGKPGTRDSFSVVRRDAHGNALGGIRLAQFAVATATNSGANEQPGACFGFGSHTPFDSATLARLYPTTARYVAEVNRITDENLRAGFITREAADMTRKVAASWKPPG